MTAALDTGAPKPSIFSLEAGAYKVYKDAKEFVTVNAKSALEAIKTSGMENIYRIERDSLEKNYVLEFAKASELLLKNDVSAAAATAPAAEAPKA